MPWVAAARLHESTKAGPLAECAPVRILLLSACTIAPWAVFWMFSPMLQPAVAKPLADFLLLLVRACVGEQGQVHGLWRVCAQQLGRSRHCPSPNSTAASCIERLLTRVPPCVRRPIGEATQASCNAGGLVRASGQQRHPPGRASRAVKAASRCVSRAGEAARSPPCARTDCVRSSAARVRRGVGGASGGSTGRRPRSQRQGQPAC